MKITKNHPLGQQKLTDHLDDTQNGVFKLEWLSSFDKEIVITFSLLRIFQKEYIFKLPSVDKVTRVEFLKGISAVLFKAGKYDKAEKIYQRV